MVLDNPTPQPNLSPASDENSRIARQATVRKLREIVVYQHELNHLSLLNTLAAGFFSAASASAFFVLGLITNAWMQEGLSDKAKGGLEIGVPIGVLMTLAFAIAGIASWCAKGSETAQLLQQAIDIDQAAPALVTPEQSNLSTEASPLESV